MVSNRKRATQWDVARKAGVSQATVSLVLGGSLLGGRAKTTARVLKVAGELGYRPNRSAQALRTGRTRTIAVVVPDICNPFFPSLLKGAQSVADDAGYDVITLNTAGQRESERRILRWGIEGRVDGVIGVFFTLHANEFRPLIDAGVGVVRVEFDPQEAGPSADRQSVRRQPRRRGRGDPFPHRARPSPDRHARRAGRPASGARGRLPAGAGRARA